MNYTENLQTLYSRKQISMSISNLGSNTSIGDENRGVFDANFSVQSYDNNNNISRQIMNTATATSITPPDDDFHQGMKHIRGLERISRRNADEKDDLIHHWISFLDQENSNVSLSTSSLTEDSDVTLRRLGTGDNDPNNCRSTTMTRDDEDDIHARDTICNNVEKMSTDKTDFKKSCFATNVLSEANISSYAQLFFDPETQMLVTLMEMNFGLDYHDKKQVVEDHRNKASCQLTHLKAATENAIIKNTNTSSSPDQTLLTECCSLSSSETTSYSTNIGCDFGVKKIKHHHPIVKKTCLLDEPIVFSHDVSLNQGCYFEERDFDVYLLQDNDHLWDYRSTKERRCTDSLKKLLLASRGCVSLPLVGESKWKALKLQNALSKAHCKNSFESLSYSVLKNVH